MEVLSQFVNRQFLGKVNGFGKFPCLKTAAVWEKLMNLESFHVSNAACTLLAYTQQQTVNSIM